MSKFLPNGGSFHHTKTSTALRSIQLAVDENRIGPGGSGARFITASDGNLWVMKANFLGGQLHRYLCLNEALCTLRNDDFALPTYRTSSGGDRG